MPPQAFVCPESDLGMIMKVQQLRKLIEELSPDTEIAVCDGVETFELYGNPKTYPAINDIPTVFVISIGMSVDQDFDLDNREAS